MNPPDNSNSKGPAKRVEGDLLHTGEQGEHHSHGLVHQPAAQEPLKDEDLALAGQGRTESERNSAGTGLQRERMRFTLKLRSELRFIEA
jgi:hypothetical protein